MRKSNDNVNQLPATARSTQGAEVLDLVHRVMHQVRSQQYQVLRDGSSDITHMESKVLGFVGRHPGSTQSDLAQHSGRDKAQLARLVKGLRERELLVAQADPADRRNVHLQLSAAGQAVQRALRHGARALNQRAVRGLDAGEQAQLAALLGRVKANLDEAD